MTTRSQAKILGDSNVDARRSAIKSGVSWAQRIASERDLEAEVVQQVLIRAAALAVSEGIVVGAPLAARMIGLPDDEAVVSVEGAVALADGSMLEAQAALRRELTARAARMPFDRDVRSLVEGELKALEVPRRERARARDLLYQVAALAPGETPAVALERVLTEVDPVVQVPIREMVRAAGWSSLERWLSEVTFWWVA